LIEIAEVIAADAAELSNFTLEQSCHGQIAKHNMAQPAIRQPTEMPCLWQTISMIVRHRKPPGSGE
jgi:hypothetical protein